MSPNPPPDVTTPRCKRHRFPAEIIAHAVWLYFPLSLRHVEDLLAERGIEVSFQTVAEWAAKIGREYARSIRVRSSGSFADTDGLPRLSFQRTHSGTLRCRWEPSTPTRQFSSGGKERLGRVSKAGQADIRRLLIIGAMARVNWAMLTKQEDYRDPAMAVAA
jgi:hypothetical protein